MRYNKKSPEKIEWKSAVNAIKLKPENCYDFKNANNWFTFFVLSN